MEEEDFYRNGFLVRDADDGSYFVAEPLELPSRVADD